MFHLNVFEQATLYCSIMLVLCSSDFFYCCCRCTVFSSSIILFFVVSSVSPFADRIDRLYIWFEFDLFPFVFWFFVFHLLISVCSSASVFGPFNTIRFLVTPVTIAFVVGVVVYSHSLIQPIYNTFKLDVIVFQR